MTCTTKGCERPVYSEYAKRCRPCDIVRTDSHIKGMEAQQMLTLQDMTNEQLAAFIRQAMTEQEERLIECARELESASFQH